MPNKSSPHGGRITEGTVSHGTLRTQDLLLSFASEYERILPFNSSKLVSEARQYADHLENGAADADIFDEANDCLNSLIDGLNECAIREGMYFGNTEGDGTDFGFWMLESEEEEEGE